VQTAKPGGSNSLGSVAQLAKGHGHVFAGRGKLGLSGSVKDVVESSRDYFDFLESERQGIHENELLDTYVPGPLKVSVFKKR